MTNCCADFPFYKIIVPCQFNAKYFNCNRCCTHGDAVQFYSIKNAIEILMFPILQLFKQTTVCN